MRATYWLAAVAIAGATVLGACGKDEDSSPAAGDGEGGEGGAAAEPTRCEQSCARVADLECYDADTCVESCLEQEDMVPESCGDPLDELTTCLDETSSDDWECNAADLPMPKADVCADEVTAVTLCVLLASTSGTGGAGGAGAGDEAGGAGAAGAASGDPGAGAAAGDEAGGAAGAVAGAAGGGAGGA
jgi:hypothetical protein